MFTLQRNDQIWAPMKPSSVHGYDTLGQAPPAQSANGVSLRQRLFALSSRIERMGDKVPHKVGLVFAAFAAAWALAICAIVYTLSTKL